MEMEYIFAQLALALYHFHKDGKCIHQNVKPQNVILDGTLPADSFGGPFPMLRLSGTGLAKALDGNNRTEASSLGTPRYQAPELYNNDGYVRSQADWWSFGI